MSDNNNMNSVICDICNKEFKRSINYRRHINGITKCRIALLERQLEEKDKLIEEKNELIIELKSRPTTVNNYNTHTHNEVVDNRKWNINLVCKTPEEYFKSIDGLISLEEDESKYIRKIELYVLNNKANHYKDYSYHTLATLLYGYKTIGDAIVIHDKKRGYVDGKLNRKVERILLHSEIYNVITKFHRIFLDKLDHKDRKYIKNEDFLLSQFNRDLVNYYDNKRWNKLKNRQLGTTGAIKAGLEETEVKEITDE